MNYKINHNSEILFRTPRIIEGSNLVLRKLVLKDAKDFYYEINEINVLKYLHITKPETVSDIKGLIRYFRKNWRKNLAFTFSIFLKNSDSIKNKSRLRKFNTNKLRFCGSINLANINYYDKSGEIGIWLGTKYWNKGINYEAIVLMLKCGFDNLLLNKINALILPENHRSIKTFEKLNFQFEGKKKNPFDMNSNGNNLLIYSILRKEFEKDVYKHIQEISSEKI